MKKTTPQKLEETSQLAQAIADKMKVELDTNGFSQKWNSFLTLKIIVNEADSQNSEIYHDNDPRICGRQIVICDIPSLAMQHGTNFDREGMRSKLLGLAERYQVYGNYLVSVNITHDLNSARINDVSALMDAISYG